ncbi:transcription factor CP2-like isoform X2 [Mytilus edulis]
MSYGWSSDELGTTGSKRTKMSHHNISITSWDINDSLAADFDGSLSGLGNDLGSGTYNMSEALLALPVFKQENLDTGFQYILGAATSPAVKLNEETLTYLNQGQSYEVKMKKLGDLSDFQGKYLKSIIRVCFHERRLQYMEKEQMESWKQTRPGERILELDIPLSYGIIHYKKDTPSLNTIDFVWDPTKECGIYIKVHCISTEFTQKKHGGEKGVPFRIQVETHTYGDEDSKLLHCASCQVKVFKPKGADRKHKTDREKIDKLNETDKDKYQPSYECTVLTQINVDQMASTILQPGPSTPSSSAALGESSFIGRNGSFANLSESFSQINTNSPTPPSMSAASSPFRCNSEEDNEKKVKSPEIKTSKEKKILDGIPLPSDAIADTVSAWLQANRFSSHVRVFQNFSGPDILRLTRDDLIQICGIADGIRLNNALQSKAVRPRLTIFVCQETDSVYHALYLDTFTSQELIGKLAKLYSVSSQQIAELYCSGPSGIYILITNEVVQNFKDQARFVVEAMKDENSMQYKILLKEMS